MLDESATTLYHAFKRLVLFARSKCHFWELKTHAPSKIKSNFRYTRDITPKRATSDGTRVGSIHFFLILKFKFIDFEKTKFKFKFIDFEKTTFKFIKNL